MPSPKSGIMRLGLLLDYWVSPNTGFSCAQMMQNADNDFGWNLAPVIAFAPGRPAFAMVAAQDALDDMKLKLPKPTVDLKLD